MNPNAERGPSHYRGKPGLRPPRDWRCTARWILAVSIFLFFFCSGSLARYDHWAEIYTQSATLSTEIFSRDLTRCTGEELAHFTASHFTPLRRFLSVLAVQSVLQSGLCLLAQFFRRPRRGVLTVLLLLQAAVCAGNCAMLAGAKEVFFLEAPAGFYLTALLCCTAAPLWLLFRLWRPPTEPALPPV